MEEKQGRQEKLTTGGNIVIKSRFLTWLDNFWYHYKWHVIVIAFFVFLGVVCFVQCASKPTGDMTVAFAGNYTLSGAQKESINNVFNGIAPKKEYGDGRETVILTDFSAYSEDELKSLYTDENGDFAVAAYNNAKQVNTENIKNFATYVQTGDSAVWLVSKYVYEYQNLDVLSVPLSELYETAPESAVDEGEIGYGYAILLGDTELYQYYDALKVLPADTLVLMPKSFALWGESSNEERYQTFLQLYHSIVEFEAP